MKVHTGIVPLGTVCSECGRTANPGEHFGTGASDWDYALMECPECWAELWEDDNEDSDDFPGEDEDDEDWDEDEPNWHDDRGWEDE